MTDETGSPDGSAVDSPRDTGGDLSIMDAVKLTVNERNKPKEQPAESAETATAEPELAQANDDPEEPAPIEATEDAEPAGEPPIEPPRSWTKAEKERFQSLPRETQEYLHTREQERERDFRRSQNEVAEERKAAKAEREAAEQVRKQYEAKLPQVMQTIQETGPFSDIRSMADVEKLQTEDPFRFQAFQLHQWKIQAAQADLAESEKRQQQEQHTQWAQHVQKENELASEYIPELADKVKGPALTQRASERLNELGFKQEELAALASGKQKLSLYDHRIQRLIFSDLKLSDIQSATKAVAQKTVPPVQRPGTPKPQGNAGSEKLQALQERFNRTGSLKDAQALHAAEFSQKRRA